MVSQVGRSGVRSILIPALDVLKMLVDKFCRDAILKGGITQMKLDNIHL